MDIRGVEITNQLRSAIRAKLLELGVRYDEELPDYILVMVVNKKSRQQMNEDLHLFLEDSTESFVNWLHDQVLKKLQKVTVKKKNTKEIGSSVVIKEEKERKKIKIENQSNSISGTGEIITKVDRDREFEELVGDLALLNEDDDKIILKKSLVSEEKLQKKKNFTKCTNSHDISNNLEKRDTDTSSTMMSKTLNSDIKIKSSKLSQIEASNKISDISCSNLKRTSNIDNISSEKNCQNTKRSKISDDFNNKNDDKFKSSINKPKITSVVSVKTRLGIISPTKQPEVETKKYNIIRNTLNKNHVDIRRSETINQRNSFNQNINVDTKKQQIGDLRTEQNKNDKLQFNNLKQNKSNKIENFENKERSNNKSGTIKSRLGTSITHKQDEPPIKSCNSIKISKPRISNVKSRLGIRKSQQIRVISDTVSKHSQITQNSKSFQEEDDDSSINTSLKSHIIAVKKQKKQKQKQKNNESLKKQIDSILDRKQESKDDKLEDKDQCKVPSKIIVTPRPLKPLQPSLKRATQSLLLRAVAEANQSVVMQKKMDPCLKEQKPINKIKVMRNPWKGKILSVNLNSKKRLVMEKIQIELTNPDIVNSSKPHSSQIVTEEHLDMVKSLFKRSDDNQKFLVTLNGYNNNILKERNSDDEENIEMEINEDDELVLTNNQYGSHIKNDKIMGHKHDINEDNYIDETHMNEDHEINENTETEYIEPKVENNENNCIENLGNKDNFSKKKRKLSPIIYTRSRSSSLEGKPMLASTISSVLRIDKRPLISSVITTVTDKSNEKCRYWPNCTLGIKCAYYHPEVLCSSFPACKFGEKCAYKHPKCKFGSSCTKLGCMFSHPPVQCKYHPYCMKPGCPFSHPKTSITTSLTPDISNVRAKFTWKKKE